MHKKVYICYGRYQPLTIGHVSHFNEMFKLHCLDSDSLGCFVTTSYTQDKVANPLPLHTKIDHISEAVSDTPLQVFGSRDPFQAVIDLVDFYKEELTEIVYCAGGDYFNDPAEASMFTRLSKFISKYTNGNTTVTALNTGDRVEGISGTDMRLLAWTDNWEKFKQYAPIGHGNYTEKHARESFEAIRSSEHERALINKHITR